MAGDAWVTIYIDAVWAETALAFKVDVITEDDDEVNGVWLPKSQMEDPDALTVGDTGIEVNVSTWIAREKGLVDDE